ncbi:MAG: hypothetical protein LBB48_06105 [Treponema sp.]|jgi:hypothetical protein|nr:hypothetical protein [Treponema sp.]
MSSLVTNFKTGEEFLKKAALCRKAGHEMGVDEESTGNFKSKKRRKPAFNAFKNLVQSLFNTIIKEFEKSAKAGEEARKLAFGDKMVQLLMTIPGCRGGGGVVRYSTGA